MFLILRGLRDNRCGRPPARLWSRRAGVAFWPTRWFFATHSRETLRDTPLASSEPAEFAEEAGASSTWNPVAGGGTKRLTDLALEDGPAGRLRRRLPFVFLSACSLRQR